ncbi:MAG: hypothetical protein SFV54_02780 [Bryobacteraceae bacterium]|nr:hypothetical protein [Bryobacteraceae bacterium]
MTRRVFGAGLFVRAAAAQAAPTFRVRRLTSGPKHHFFGYYGIPPWNRSGSLMVCLESDFQDHLPQPEEAARIGTVDPRTGTFRAVTETHAWNLQQGAMLHWNPLKPETEFLFNDREGERIVSAAYDLKTQKRRLLPRAINGVSANGRYGLCLTYGRLTRLRPVVGYVGAVDPNPDVAHPDNDGVYVMDLESGSSRLVVSIGEVYRRLVKDHPELRKRHMWFNHTVFNRDSTRFFFLARCWTPEKRLESAMFTAAVDGSDLRLVVPFGRGVSHFEWRSEQEIMATFRVDGTVRHVLFTDGKDDYRVVGAEFLKGDGHCSFAPDREWMVTDANVGLEKQLMIYNVRTREGVRLGSFPMGEQRYMSGDVRCDLHPRWNRTGEAICVDALDPESGTRQLWVVELAGLR